MKRIDKIEYLINNNGVTFLGAGPMSKNSVDAVIDLAQEYDLPIGLIPFASSDARLASSAFYSASIFL